MATEFRATLNMRLSQDANASFVVVQLVETEVEAEEMGELTWRLVNAWCHGYDGASDRGQS